MRNLINLLKEFKLEIKERFKMQRHYGMLRNPIAKLKTFRSDNSFPPSKADLGGIRHRQRDGDYTVPADLGDKLKRIKDLSKIDKQLFGDFSEITFISYSIPRLDSTSSELRLLHILKILLKNNCKINFLYCTELWNDSKCIKIFEGDINFTHLLLNSKEYVQFVAEKTSQYVWITELWRMNYVNFMAELVGELKASSTSSKLIVDTVDFHYKEFHRKYEVTENPNDLKRANEFLENEKVLYRTADTIVVISEEEKKDIQDKISGVKKIEVVPNIHEIFDAAHPYNKRKNICFVGHFGNKHNVDAVTYFIENIFHLVLERNPGVEFHVLGYSADKYKKRFESTNVKIIGGLKYLEEALTYYKLFVCPMTYGAGMKGKIGGAIAAGVPVVTTSIGAEGFPFIDTEECFIADFPEEFAERCNQCLEDPVIWHNLSIKARLMMAENFSASAVAQKLKKTLSG